MTIDQAIAALRSEAESIGGEYQETYILMIECIAVISAYVERKQVMTDEAIDRAVNEWLDTGFKFEGDHRSRMRAAIAAMEVEDGGG